MEGVFVVFWSRWGGQIRAFCDQNTEIKECASYPVMPIEQLQAEMQGTSYSIVLCTENYVSDMLKTIQDCRLKPSYVFTGWAVHNCIHIIRESTITNVISKKWKNEYVYERILNRHNYLLNTFRGILGLQSGIMVYQVGKTGSTTMYQSLLEAGGQHVIHSHSNTVREEDGSDLQTVYVYAKKFIHTNGVKIITAVRDPISRELSNIMQNFMVFSADGKFGENNFIGDIINKILEDKDCEKDFFEGNFKEFTDINVMDYPFDTEKGYGIIRDGNIEILILQMEQMNNNVHMVREFTGLNNFSFSNHNVGAKKPYTFLYEEIKKRVVMSEKMMDDILKNSFVEHFYSNEQIERVRDRWSKKRVGNQ